MTIHETAELLAMLREYFPSGQPITKDTINAWGLIFEDVDYGLISAILPEIIKEWDGYTMPPPAVFFKHLERCKDKGSDIELWNIADRLISKGTILTDDEFKQAPKEIQIYFGTVARIRDLALMPPEETANERARFLRQMPEIKKRIKARDALPVDVKNMIDGVSERKQLT